MIDIFSRSKYRPPPCPGELDALLLVFLVSLEEEPLVPARVLSETCAVVAACSPLPRSGASGTRRLAQTSVVTL